MKIMVVYVAWFKELNKDSIPVAGGKGANLGEMFNLGLPIPPGFSITAQTYKEFIERTKIKDKIQEILKNLDVNDTKKLQETAQKIQKVITSTQIPKNIADDIKHAYELLGADQKKASDLLNSKEVFVAVRSSATAEDLPEASFAGQQATFLNVRGKENVIEAVRNCWASLFTARAIYYREKNKFDHSKVLISAIVQMMVNSEQSGIMFTINPATNRENEIVIEAVWGLGEMIVGGEVNPDLYIVDKKTKEIKKVEVKKQLIGMFRDENGNNIKSKIPEHQQNQRVIPDTIVKELARYGKKIEEHYGKPQDIEWAVDKGQVYIVQSRAVTTFKETKTDSPIVAKGKIILKGETAASGVAFGPVTVVREISQLDKVQKGDVMVAVMTTPDMVPAMQKASAIITDEGGMTCIEGDAKLFTNKGFVKMKEVGKLLEEGNELKTISVDAKTKKVVWRKILFSMQRKNKTLEISPYLHPTNKLNDKIRITADHKMPVLKGDQLNSLQLQQLIESNNNLFVIDNIPKLDDNDINLDIFDKNKLMYLCGSIFSDGHIVKRKSGKPMRVMFSQKLTKEKELYINTVTSHFNSIFGAELKNYTPPLAIVEYEGSQWQRAANFECSRVFPAQTLQSLKDNLVQVISSIEEEHIISFFGGIIDGDGHFNEEKSCIEIYANANDTNLVESITVACLRLNIFPEVTRRKENVFTIKIKDKVDIITKKCTRVKAHKKEVEDRKQFDAKIFESLNLNDWRGNLYNYFKTGSFIGIGWLKKYLEGRCEDEKYSQISSLEKSDLRMKRLMVTGETESIDVYNITIDAENDDDHNYVVFTNNYTPLLVYNCHAAIVSREMGTPCLVGTEHATKVLTDGQIVTVYATKGVVYEGKVDIKEAKKKLVASGIKTNIKVKVIVDLPDVAARAAQTGADGVGLVRLEIMIANGGIHPAEYIRQGKKDQYVKLLKEGIGKIAKAFAGKPVWVRCSDMRSDEYRNLKGGDKEPKETDPMIGWHAIRRLLDEPEILKAEFQAIRELHYEGMKNVGVMIPFVIRVEELRKAKEIMREIGLEPCKAIDFGVMVETPASCWIIEDLCKEGISFVSFGTNDLTQLTLGIDRNNQRIAKLFDEMHPAVLGEIAKVIKVCQKYNVQTSICGQAGSRQEMASFLVHQGVDSISANADVVDSIRAVVAREEKNLK